VAASQNNAENHANKQKQKQECMHEQSKKKKQKQSMSMHATQIKACMHVTFLRPLCTNKQAQPIEQTSEHARKAPSKQAQASK